MGIFNTILCIGDSLTYGARDEYRRGYPIELSQILNDYCDNKQFWVCINEGISGERSADILRRAPDIMYKYGNDVYVAIIQAGTNDTLDKVPVEIFRDNMFQLIRTVQLIKPVNGGRKVILGSLISLEGIGLMSYTNDGHKILLKYNEVLKDLSRELNIPLVDLRCLEKYRNDKCHLTNEGYREMAKLYFEEIKKI
jgi:lysophospholipase L1-like esterase